MAGERRRIDDHKDFREQVIEKMTTLGQRQEVLIKDVIETKGDVKRLASSQEQMTLAVARHEQTLYGEKGENGLVASVKSLWRSIDKIKLRVAMWGGGIAVLAILAPFLLKRLWP